MPKFEIKPFTEQYRDQVFSLILKIQNEEFGVPITVQDQPDLANISSTYQKNNGNFWVALQEEEVIGTIALNDIGDGKSALKKMYVSKNYRGNVGVGKLLLDNLFDWCQKKNIQEIYLGTTAYFLAAQRFYEKNGFVEISRDKVPSQFPFTKYQTKFYLHCVIPDKLHVRL